MALLNDGDWGGGGSSAEAEYDTGVQYAGALGFAVDQVRGEVEVLYRSNPIDSFGGAAVSASADGDLSALGLMANVSYVVDTGTRLLPHIGVGIGYARVSADDVRIRSPAGGAVTTIDDESWEFAYQAIAGATYHVLDRVGIDLSYRYFATADADLSSSEGEDVEVEYRGHGFSLGAVLLF